MTRESAVPAEYMDQVRRVAREEAASALRSGATRNLTLSEGGSLIVRGGRLWVLHPASEGGLPGVTFGPIYGVVDGLYQGTGLIVEDADGSDIATFRSDDATGNPLCILWDATGNAVVNTSTSGLGLGRPYIPFNFYPARFNDTPQFSTSTTFETLWVASGYKINPGMYVAAASMCDVGTTGEIRVLVNGVALGSTEAIVSSGSSHSFGPAAVAGDLSTYLTIQIQGRVASGAGALRIVPQIGTGYPV